MLETPKEAKQSICFLVGSVALSGGTYVIFQHAQFLQEKGYNITIAVQEPFDETTTSWHDYGHKLNCVPFDEAKVDNYGLVIATWWKTALQITEFKAQNYGYFVQSIESRFYSEEESPLRDLVNATYKLPVSYITEAVWIKEYLHQNFCQDATLVRNGIRKDIYRARASIAAPPQKRTQPRVLVEGHFNVPFKNTALAVKLARAAGARDIWVLTGSAVKRLPGVSRVFSRVPIHETANIYSACDILLKLSTVEGMFGPPLEIFHCGGTALVFDVTGHDEYIVHNENAIVIKGLNTEKVVEELSSLLSDSDRLAVLKQGAAKTAKDWPDWMQSSNLFCNWVEQVLAESKPCSTVAMEETIRAAWKTYETNEQIRLKTKPRASVLQSLKTRVVASSPRVKELIKYIMTVIEVINPSRRVF
ncbi:glycosyltransferase [Ahrensia marina]|uniref:Glycosyl transferase family 1 n=1 Tax=Ahrensia marina TaxID=1514904 RepID=A0A0M9GKG5_9HYPH|nr:glycosyltransferase [Ahrensia marina]KPA99886.1 glycosyl transferase family 1 [Ahrensia marina]